MLYLFRKMMRSIFRTGQFTVIEPNGKTIDYGDGSGDRVVERIADHKTILKLLVHSDLYLGEAYVDGTLTMEQGTIYDLLALAVTMQHVVTSTHLLDGRNVTKDEYLAVSCFDREPVDRRDGTAVFGSQDD